MKRALGMAVIILVCGRSGARAATTVNSHTLFFNNCQPNGCAIRVGNTNALTDTSDLPSHASTVTAFSQSATVWASILSCARSVMAPFNLTITDQRPASGDYFEVIVAGSSTDVGEPAGVGALADTPCSAIGVCNAYQPDAVAFAFANESFYAGNPNQICGAALQALALTWALDHVVDASDVLSYNTFTGVQTFHDGEACGSDCQGGLSPFGSTCTGNGGNATHVCVGTNTATQDEVKTILALFGPAATGGNGGAAGVGGAAGGGGAAGVGGAAGGGGAAGVGGGGGTSGAAGAGGGGASGAAGTSGAGGAGGGATGGASGASGGGGARTDGGVTGESGNGGARTDGGGTTTSSGGGCGCAVEPTERTPATLMLLAAILVVLRARRRPRLGG